MLEQTRKSEIIALMEETRLNRKYQPPDIKRLTCEIISVFEKIEKIY